MGVMTSRWFPEGPITVRPRTGWVFLFLTTLVTGPVLVSAFVPVRSTTAAVAVTAVVATIIAYIYFVAPRVVVGEDVIRVDNPWRRHEVPWGALIDVETRFNLTLVTPQERVHVLAAPSPGGLSAMRSRPDQDRATVRLGDRQGGAVRPGDLPSSLSGALAAVIRGHWQDLVEAGAISPGELVRTSPRPAHLAVTVGGLALSVLLWVLA
jgi:hypothetical protein